MKKKKIKKKFVIALNILLVLAVMVAIYFAYMFFVYYQKAAPKLPDNIILEINGVKIPEEEYRYYLAIGKAYYESEAGEDVWDTTINGISAVDTLKTSIIGTIIKRKIEVLKAEEFHVAIDQDVLAEAVQEISAVTVYARKNVEEGLLINALKEEITKNFDVDEDAFRDYLIQENVNLNEASELEIEMYKENYIQKMKEEIYDETYLKWREESTIRLNEKRIKEIF